MHGVKEPRPLREGRGFFTPADMRSNLQFWDDTTLYLPWFRARHIPCRSRLVGEGGLESGAALSGLFAGKPAPTKTCLYHGFVRDIYRVGAGLPAKAALSLVLLYRAASLASQLLQKCASAVVSCATYTLPAKAALSLVLLYRAASLASQLLQKCVSTVVSCATYTL
ncbi:hypothetical protein EMIT0P218_120077 [Pseudomonas sp. IT-P218]